MAAKKKTTKKTTKQMLRIVSKVEGFRRCGVAHPAQATHYGLDHFDKDQKAHLEAEPNLICDVVDVEVEVEVEVEVDAEPETDGPAKATNQDDGPTKK